MVSTRPLSAQADAGDFGTTELFPGVVIHVFGRSMALSVTI